MANGQNTVLQTYPPAHNGQQMQFANINFAMEGVRFPFFQSIEYSDNVDRAHDWKCAMTSSAVFQQFLSVGWPLREKSNPSSRSYPLLRYNKLAICRTSFLRFGDNFGVVIDLVAILREWKNAKSDSSS